MNAHTSRLLAVAAAVTMLSACGSTVAIVPDPQVPLAAAPSEISVQLDGGELSFPNAAPRSGTAAPFCPYAPFARPWGRR